MTFKQILFLETSSNHRTFSYNNRRPLKQYFHFLMFDDYKVISTPTPLLGEHRK